jgi:hypothetical protein
MESNMAHGIGKAAILCGLAGALAIGAATPSLAQYVVVSPGGPYGYYVGPYGAFAYAPGGYPSYGGYRYDGPAGYDTGGAPYYYGDLGWQWGPSTGAPANPCTPGQRSFNRC